MKRVFGLAFATIAVLICLHAAFDLCLVFVLSRLDPFSWSEFFQLHGYDIVFMAAIASGIPLGVILFRRLAK